MDGLKSKTNNPFNLNFPKFLYNVLHDKLQNLKNGFSLKNSLDNSLLDANIFTQNGYFTSATKVSQCLHSFDR